MRSRLSKSRIMQGLQCPKALYLAIHHPELAPPVGKSQQVIFDRGHQVGELAQKRFPGGILIDAPYTDPEAALRQTQVALANPATTAIFEATFVHEGVLVKADILHRENSNSPWELIEVKSATSCKREYLPDAAVQAWVIRGAGVSLWRVSILHINTNCVYPDLDQIFSSVDVTRETEELLPGLLAEILNLRVFLEKSGVPELPIGPHCDDPHPCAFMEHCWRQSRIPELSVLDVPSLGARKWELFAQGKVRLEDLRGEVLSSTQARVVEVSLSGKRFVDRVAIQQELSRWRHPLLYLDFETIAFVPPRYPGTRPYQQVPFQFSLHIQLQPGGPVAHTEYLHEDVTDPRPAIIQALLASLGTEGSIVSYNATFEGQRIEEMAKAFPEHAARLRALLPRLVDPLPLMRRAVYDKAFHGSFSIKSVAPALLGPEMSYEGMLVADGGDAQLAFEELIHPATPAARRGELRAAMIDYCRKDTLAMVHLVAWLETASPGRTVAGE